MSGFTDLCYPMRKYASEHGMTEPTPIQKDGFEALLHTDKHIILSGPTAGGKTFAVYGALLSLVEDFSQRGAKILDILPTKALINDQFGQVSEICDYMYVPVTKWHGDVKQSEKNKFIREPEGVLLITPESLEAKFQNNADQINDLFAGLRFTVLDEIHQYYGRERGCQLISLLYRLRQRVGNARIVAMSATIGKNDYLARVYTGDPDNTVVVRDNSVRQTDFTLRYYPQKEESKDLPKELLNDVYAEIRDQKGMVFCNSRGTTEEVAVGLKEHDPEKFGSHHSSVSKENREDLEAATRQGEKTPCCTSTMEPGINIGTISVVCMVESPYSVSSFTQRAGRSGRSTGKAVVRMFCSEEWSLVRGIACWNLANGGYAESPDLSVEWHNVALQQVISTVKEKGPVSRQALVEEFIGNPAFPFNTPSDYENYIENGLDQDIFAQAESGDGLILGAVGEKLVGKKDSYIVFPTTCDYRVMDQNRWVGDHERSTEDKKGDCFYLSSMVWQVTGIDDEKHLFHVIPAPEGKKPKYTSFGLIIGEELEQEMKDVLLSADSYSFLDDNGKSALSALREKFSQCSTMGKARMPYYISKAGLLCIYPFAGTKIFNTLKLLFDATEDGYELSMNLTLSQFLEKCRSILAGQKSLLPVIEEMLGRGEIPLRHRYEKYLGLSHQARLEYTLNYDEKGTLEYLKEIIA